MWKCKMKYIIKMSEGWAGIFDASNNNNAIKEAIKTCSVHCKGVEKRFLKNNEI